MNSAHVYSQMSYQSQSVSQTTILGSGIMKTGLTGTESLQKTERKSGNAELLEEAKEQISADAEGKDGLKDWYERFQIGNVKVTKTPADRCSHLHKMRQQMLQYILEQIFCRKGTGKKEKIDPVDQLTSDIRERLTGMNSTQVLRMDTVTTGFYYQETEATAFGMDGKVRTEDGRELDIHVNMVMSRRFTEAYESSVQSLNEIVLTDPLVINLDTQAAKLADQTFFFDLDADGTKDEVHMLQRGSGFLALDRNGDGIINDGSELFGTASGDGFADLMIYDEDHNGWIDENDSIWKSLKIWAKDDSGKDELYTLEKAGVGAICLSSVDTEFTDKGKKQDVYGKIRQTGMFLYESGMAGTIQQLDLATAGGYA